MGEVPEEHSAGGEGGLPLQSIALHCRVVHALAGPVSLVCWRWSEVGCLVARRLWRYRRRMTQLQRMTENWKK